jgi:hypothetical protein
MSTQDRAYATPVRIHADHAAPKRLGDWTTARAFEVRARHAEVTVGVQSGGVAQLSASPRGRPPRPRRGRHPNRG